MKNFRGNFLKKTMLSSSITAALSVGIATQSQADIYEFTFANAGCTVSGTNDTCVGPGDATFTILNGSGTPTQNTSYPYYADADWGYGLRTQIGGSLVISAGTGTGTGTGTMSINSFEFFASGPAVASNITFADLNNANDPTNTLWMGQMLFDWNGSNGIPVSIVWDMSGLLSNLTNSIGGVVNGVGSLPASNSMSKGAWPFGLAPIATTSFDTTDLCGNADGIGGNADDAACALGLNPSGTTPILTDGAGVGGSPMVVGPFAGFNANFDFKKLTLAGFNDTTKPVLTLGSSTLTIAEASTFDPLASGVSVTCSDAADGADDITNGVGVNANVSFAVVSNTVNTAAEGVYSVVYTCSDNASARAALTDDPNNVGFATVPADNTSDQKTLTVTVNNPNRPSITILGDNPQTSEACLAYVDPGATATDLQDDDTVLTAAIDATGGTLQDGDVPTSESTLTVTYNVTDSGTGNPVSTPFAAFEQVRTVNVVDTTAPVVTVSSGLSVSIESTACAAFNATLPTATVVDANGDCSGAAASTISTSSTVICVVPEGQDTVQSSLIYTGADLATTPNETTATAVVTVSRSEPVISLNGGGVVLDIGEAYTEPGIDIHDVQDGDVTDAVVGGTTSGITYTMTDNIDTSVAGSYTVTYNATDSDTNVATTVTRSVRVGVFAKGSNFTMLNPAGTTFGGTNDVTVDWDESLNTDVASTNFNMTIASALPQPFFGFLWTAHHIRVFGPGSYSFDTTCTTAQLEAGVSACNNPLVGTQTERFITMEVAAGQVGVHILFDWNGTLNIDVVNVWDRDAVWIDPDGAATTKNNLFDGESGLPPDITAPWALVSTDFDADGIVGSPMVDGPFIGFFANFNIGGVASTEERVPYSEQVDIETDFTSKPSVGSMGWLAILLSPVALLIAARRRLK